MPGELTDQQRQKLFAEVVSPHLDDAFSLARWLTADRADAEDVTQEACLRAFSGVGHYAGGNTRAWLLTIVRNTAYTWLAKNRPKGLVLTDDMEAAERGAPRDDDAPTPETEMIAAFEAAALTTAIETLPVVFRETLVLRDINGL